MLLIVSLGLSAAFLFAVSASLQQHEAHKANRAIQQRAHQASGSRRPGPVGAGHTRPAVLLALAQRLPRSRLWRVGWAVNLSGFLVQGAALRFGSVALVQPLLVTQLLFALPLTTWWSRRWPSGGAWLSGAAICGGVTVYIVVVHGGAPLTGEADRARIILAGLAAIAVIAVLVRAAAKRPPLVQAALTAVGAGLCFAISAALMKLTAEDLVERGVGATALDWPGYALALSATTGVVLGQWAYATGSLPTAVAAMTITNPVASYFLGVLAFHLPPATTPGQLAGVAGAAVLTSAGVAGLARSSVVRPAQSSRPAGSRPAGSRPAVIAPEAHRCPQEGPR